MPDLFEINDSFEPCVASSNSAQDTVSLQHSNDDLNLLEFFFDSLIEIKPSQPSYIPLLSKLYNQLKNNQFTNATQTIKDHPHCLEQMNNALPTAKLALFVLFLLRKKLAPIVKLIWENNSQLISYFNGEAIQVQHLNAQGVLETQIEQLTFSDLVVYFKAALAGRNSDIIRSMWENIPQLPSYFSGQVIQLQIFNAQGDLETQIWQLATPQLIEYFKSALASHSSMIIESMWGNENSPLQNAIKTLNDASLIELIEKVLASNKKGKSKFITTFLNFVSSKHLLKACLNLRKPRKQSIYTKNQVLALKTRLTSLISDSLVLNSEHSQESNLNNLENNEFLESFEHVFAEEFTQIALEAQIWQLTIPELMTYFKSILVGRNFDIIKSIWESNPQFASYFSGKAIEVPVLNAQGVLEPQTLQLSIPELIAHFKMALTSHSSTVIQSMWENENSPLQEAIKTLDDAQLIELTEKVLSSDRNGKSKFISTFLNFISNKPVLETCLNKRSTKKQSYYTKNQIKALSSRLAALALDSTVLYRESSVSHINHMKSDELQKLLEDALIDEYGITTSLHPSSILIEHSMFSSASQNKKRLRNEQDDSLPQNKFQKW